MRARNAYTISSLEIQVIPEDPDEPIAVMVVRALPSTAIFLREPPLSKAIQRPSGENSGYRPPSVPGSTRADS